MLLRRLRVLERELLGLLRAAPPCSGVVVVVVVVIVVVVVVAAAAVVVVLAAAAAVAIIAGCVPIPAAVDADNCSSRLRLQTKPRILTSNN